MSQRKFIVLLVEDDPDDVFLTVRAMRQAGLPEPAYIARDGEAAVDYLAKLEPEQLPDLVLLDIKLPMKNGFEVLEWIRSQPALQSLRVAILSGSNLESDRARAAELNAIAYFVKPLGIGYLPALGRQICGLLA